MSASLLLFAFVSLPSLLLLLLLKIAADSKRVAVSSYVPSTRNRAGGGVGAGAFKTFRTMRL